MSWSIILSEKPSEIRKTLRFYEEQEKLKEKYK